MTSIADTPLKKLEAEHRLLNPVVSAPSTKVKGRYLFRGELALKHAQVKELEKRPPELKAEQVIMAATEGETALQFAAFSLLSFESLKTFAEVCADILSPTGTYIAFCSNIDLGSSYSVAFSEVVFRVLPLDESTVYNELLELMRIEKNDLKKLDSAGKLDAIVDGPKKLRGQYPRITYERGLELMGPVKNPGENRPV
ncbi:MAG: hypothetical protein RL385_4840 [Pseudomonadota bacterium]|jgi:hypothetical protein